LSRFRRAASGPWVIALCIEWPLRFTAALVSAASGKVCVEKSPKNSKKQQKMHQEKPQNNPFHDCHPSERNDAAQMPIRNRCLCSQDRARGSTAASATAQCPIKQNHGQKCVWVAVRPRRVWVGIQWFEERIDSASNEFPSNRLVKSAFAISFAEVRHFH
jgi:hypothetical protein